MSEYLWLAFFALWMVIGALAGHCMWRGAMSSPEQIEATLGWVMMIMMTLAGPLSCVALLIIIALEPNALAIVEEAARHNLARKDRK